MCGSLQYFPLRGKVSGHHTVVRRSALYSCCEEEKDSFLHLMIYTQVRDLTTDEPLEAGETGEIVLKGITLRPENKGTASGE